MQNATQNICTRLVGARGTASVAATTLPAFPATLAKSWVTGIVNMTIGSPSTVPDPIQHTSASYSRDIISELEPNSATVSPTAEGETDGFQSWILSVPISIPTDISNPILESLSYDIRYTSFRAGNVFVQTDIVISNTVDVAGGIIRDSASLGLYTHDGETRRSEGYTPPMLDETLSVCLSSRPSFKGPASSGRCDYIDHYEIHPYAQINGSNDDISVTCTRQLHLFFHVYQRSCAGASRNIDVNVTATWSDGNKSKRREEKWKGGAVEEVEKEKGRLIVAQRKAELVIQRLEECTRAAVKEDGKGRNAIGQLEGRLLAIEGRVDEMGQASFGDAALMEKENVTAMALGVVEKFREEVQRLGREEDDRRTQAEEADIKRGEELTKRLDEGMEQRRREEAEHREWMAVEKEERRKFAEEVERFKPKELETRASTEAEKEERRRFHEEVEQRRREEAKIKEYMEIEREERKKFREEVEQFRHEQAEARARENRKTYMPKTFEEAPQVPEGPFLEHILRLVRLLERKCPDTEEWEKSREGEWYQCGWRGRDCSMHKRHFLVWSELVCSQVVPYTYAI